MEKRKYYWTQKNGQQIDVDAMDVNHLRNVVKMILRNLEIIELKEKQKRREKFKLHGDIANDLNDQMELAMYQDEMSYGLGYEF